MSFGWGRAALAAGAGTRWRRRGRGLLRSASVRFAALYALLLALSGCGLAFFFWYETAGLLDRQTENAIISDADSLVERWLIGGLPALVMTVDDRLAQDVDDDAIYFLASPSGRKFVGNLQSWPSQVVEAETWYDLRVNRSGVYSMARVWRVDLPGGFHLLVGRDARVRTQLRAILLHAMLWALLVVAALATVGALVVRSLFRRTIANISATSSAIALGDFSRRVRLSGRRDEFDQLAETINVMLDRIARLMDGVRAVSNAIAHDLRTPITRARARLEDAALHATSEAELHAAIERATSDLDGIVAVFQALLRIAEIEAGSRRSAFSTFDLVPVLADLAELYEVAAEDRSIRLAVQTRGDLALYGDRELIQQAVANLLDNAIKFSPDGGTVTLSAERTEAAFEVAVRDEGPGIPPAERDRAVERFFRGEAARNTPGSGLGLATVQAIAQLHGGTLVLADAAPGLRAVLRLPTQRQQRGKSAARANPAPGQP